jgi:hypothetical protein
VPRTAALTVDSPFTVLIDSAESQPFTFDGINADSDQKFRPINVRKKWQALGRYPKGMGDYSADSLLGIAHVERKSKEDYWGTLLGWQTDYEQERGLPGRRNRFSNEFANLAEIPCPLVVVEATLHECLETCPQWGKKPAGENAKHINRKTLSLIAEFRVPILFCKSRRHAELTTYRWLTTAYRLLQEGRL